VFFLNTVYNAILVSDVTIFKVVAFANYEPDQLSMRII